jgi:hypothetical protein
MSFSFKETFSQKNLNLVVGLITLLIMLWLIMFAVPSLFVTLFDTLLGNLILIGFIILATIYNTNLGLGLGIVFMILFRFSHMSSKLNIVEGLCKRHGCNC